MFRDVVSAATSTAIFSRLMAEIDWQQETLFLFGRSLATPRLTAWYGDAAYTYSGIEHPSRAWLAPLSELRQRVECLTSARFNTVLLNLYRDGSDSMSWHSDDEPELGDNPVIASLNFGATRRFRFRNIKDRSKTLAVDLDDASLLLMGGPIQHHWQHALPKSKKPLGPRINLTFRQVLGNQAAEPGSGEDQIES
ncbi:MAG: alpha-ketoglutarate-dependent dioxygenase AlkB [Rhodospirillales bacterium]|nr:alpha-ketoglutarate-dependent dioxygenase AlkB [Rhodospirillales bacterium]